MRITVIESIIILEVSKDELNRMGIEHPSHIMDMCPIDCFNKDSMPNRVDLHVSTQLEDQLRTTTGKPRIKSKDDLNFTITVVHDWISSCFELEEILKHNPLIYGGKITHCPSGNSTCSIKLLSYNAGRYEFITRKAFIGGADYWAEKYARHTMTPFTYFLEGIGNSKKIKVGISLNPFRRCRDISRSTSVGYKLVGAIHGNLERIALQILKKHASPDTDRKGREFFDLKGRRTLRSAKDIALIVQQTARQSD